MPSPSVFISYSRKDERWKELVETHLGVLGKQGLLNVWSDRRIAAGADWLREIEAALQRADVALLLVSAHFLTSDFILGQEVPPILRRRRDEGLRVIPIICRPCGWRGVEWLSGLQGRPLDGRALSGMDEAEQDEALTALLADLKPNWEEPAANSSDPDSQALAEELEAAETRLEELTLVGKDTKAVQEEIVGIKRRLREGGSLKAGDVLSGRFRLQEVLGQGGFATVWKAYDRRGPEFVAVKVLHGQYGENRTRRERFFRGARQMARLRHEGIVRVLEREGVDGGFHYFVMEYLPGGDLREAVLAGRVPKESAPELIRQLGEALQFAHEQQVVHRDVKPANVLLDAQGHVKLTDFDLVKALSTTGGTRTGMMGTFVYAAPEALNRVQDAGPAADQYGLAMTAVFLLHGEELPPSIFRDPGAFIERLDCPPQVRQVLRKATAWEPDERFASIGDFTAALLAAVVPPRGEDAVLVKARSNRRLRPWGLAIYSALVTTLVVTLAGLVFTWLFREPPVEVSPMLEVVAEPVDGPAQPTLRPKLVSLPEGDFRMGSPAEEEGRDDDEHQHEVRLTRPFAIAQTEVTQGQYRAVMGRNPEEDCGAVEVGDDLPVVCVSWWEAVEYCNRLSDREGLERAYEVEGGGVTWNRAANGYRLPTEAEWEYAARAGTRTRWVGTDDAKEVCIYGNVADASYKQVAPSRLVFPCDDGYANLAPVTAHRANPWDLYGMVGNAWEWVWDVYGPYPGSAVEDPLGADPGRAAFRVIRGGSWWDVPRFARVANRNWVEPSARDDSLGFRVSRSP